MEKKTKTMTKAEAFEYLKGKKVRCYNIFDTDLSDKIFNKLKECGCYWRVDTNPKALIRYIDNSPYKAWALFVDDDGEISQLPISCAHFYKELGGVDIPFEDILSIEIIEEKKKSKKAEALDKISCLGAQIGDILLHMKGHHHVTITETDVILYDEDMSLFHSDPF